jgi:hypothetical protein
VMERLVVADTTIEALGSSLKMIYHCAGRLW